MQPPILRALADSCESFIYAMNTEQIAERFNSFYKKGMIALWFDATSYDAA